MESIRTRVENLLGHLSAGALEREEAIGLSLLSAAAGESIFLLGLPGVAKSMIARRLSLAFRDARRFEYLMSRFSTPDEIFGPVSISGLKDSDTYERVIDGYLPTADVAFLDEIWKAGPAIQNSLLTALNEKIFRNGRNDLRLPLKAIIAASNELPAQGEGLEALWDRFLVRYIVEPIKDKGNFLTLVTGGTAVGCEVPDDLKFTSVEMKEMLRLRDSVEVPPEILELIYTIREKYDKRAQEMMKDKASGGNEAANDPDDEDESVPYVSDRRWKKIVGILRTSALLNGRGQVDWSDCLLMEHLIWDNDSQTVMVREDICKAIVTAIMRESASNPESTGWRTKPATKGPAKFWSPDGGRHYGFDAGGELMLISASDYKKLSSVPLYGRFGTNNTVEVSNSPADFTIRCTSPGSVIINNFSYPLRLEGSMPGRAEDFLNAVANSSRNRIESFMKCIEDNLFTKSFSKYKELGRQLRRYGSKPGTTSTTTSF
ncbi:MAG: AAA family ATPase [Candidatus Cryptobacteroides sp.]